MAPITSTTEASPTVHAAWTVELLAQMPHGVGERVAVAPDLIWMSYARFAQISADDGKLRGASELVVEALAPGKANQERDREQKLVIHGRKAVQEDWIADRRAQTIDVFRRDAAGSLVLFVTLTGNATLDSPRLPDFSVPVGRLFAL